MSEKKQTSTAEKKDAVEDKDAPVTMTQAITKLFQQQMNENYQKVHQCLQKVIMNSTDLKNKVAHEGLNKPDLVVSSITGKIKQDFDKEIGNISGVNDNDQMISVKQRKEALLKKFGNEIKVRVDKDVSKFC